MTAWATATVKGTEEVKSERQKQRAERAHSDKVGVAKRQLGQIKMFLANMQQYYDRRLGDLIGHCEAEMQELVASDEYYQEAAAELWVGADNKDGCAMAPEVAPTGHGKR